MNKQFRRHKSRSFAKLILIPIGSKDYILSNHFKYYFLFLVICSSSKYCKVLRICGMGRVICGVLFILRMGIEVKWHSGN